MGFEDNFLNQLERNRTPDQNPVIAKAHEKASELIRLEAIDPKNFVDLYGEQNVTEDLNRVALTKEKFAPTETKKAAEVLEAIIYQHTELSDWFGQTAETIKTSEFDDIINAVDLVVQFNEEDNPSGHLALGVDVTFGTTSIHKKFERIRHEIEKDKLAQVKYFESHNFKGSLQQIPRVVLGVEIEGVKELAALWIHDNKKQLAEHPVRAVLLREIKEQLGVFLKFAERKKSPNAIRSYRQALALVNQIQNGTSMSAIADKVYETIVSELEQFS